MLLQEETRNLLVLGEMHPELLRLPRRHPPDLGMPGFGVRASGLDVGTSLKSWTVKWTPAWIVPAPPRGLRRGGGLLRRGCRRRLCDPPAGFELSIGFGGLREVNG
jgi:hypothetical protein